MARDAYLKAMRFLATLLLLAAFMLNIPGLHARDLSPGHAHTGQGEMVASAAQAPAGTAAMDCHHECSHIHVADRTRVLRVAEPVEWSQAAYPVEALLLPVSAEPALPDEPPRA